MSKYFHGHHESVLRSHNRRLVADSAAYILSYIKPTSKILDVGCGPATITVDFALNYVPNGSVTGLDMTDEILKIAQAHADEKKAKNVEFVKGSVFDLPFEDNTFDITHAHQVLQHIHDPVLALKEMARVTKPGGIVAARDADYGGFFWYPELPQLDKWRDVYLRSAKALKAEPYAGRKFREFVRDAGFDEQKTVISSSNYTWASPETVAWWSALWRDRTLYSSYATTAKEFGIANDQDLQEISEGWEAWGKERNALICLVHGEILYVK